MLTDDRLKFARRCPVNSPLQTDTPRFFETSTRARLDAAGADGFHEALRPLARIRLPNAQATFLVAALDPADATRAYGISQLGGHAEIGEIDLIALAEYLLEDGWTVEPDTDYAGDARALSDVVRTIR
jgi:hypothetical protein